MDAPLPPKAAAKWPTWFASALAHPRIGGDLEKLRETCRRWFSDPWGRSLETPCPPASFIADHIWSKHVPGQHEGAAPERVTPAEARRRADADVGRGEVGPALELPDTPAGAAWAQVLEQMRAGGAAAAYCAGQIQGRFRPVEVAAGCLVLEAPDKYALALLDEDFGGAALKAAVGTLGLEFRVSIAGQPADAQAGGLQ